MFTKLKDRLASATGIKTYSFDELEHAELESTDSICLSESTSRSGSIASNVSIPSNYEEYGKGQVTKILRTIRKLNNAGENKSNMPMLVFMDMIRDQQYKHVSMVMLSTFMKTGRMVPKNHLLHYYMYFLFYAAYYHQIRATTDVIDEKMKDKHHRYCICIRYQIKYLQHIIKESRLRKINL